ncbi:hypothetical protein ACFLR0_02195, partial [Candidatus Bipolaricaulota bacterium]
MKRLVVLSTVLILSAIPTLAGEYLMNDTGRTVRALRIVFSEPVTITSFGDTLLTVEPEGEADEFLFSGGEVAPWEGHGIVWTPGTARIVSYEWLAETCAGLDLPEDATAVDYEYQVPIPGTENSLTIQRTIERNKIPFAVAYRILEPVSISSYSYAWDTDKYVDTDGDGDPQNDKDYLGSDLDLMFAENFNPTVTLHVTDSSGAVAFSWENMTRNDFCAGQPVLLDGAALLQMSGVSVNDVESVQWEQLHMERVSFEYMTEYSGDIAPSADQQTELRASAAGRYVIEMQAQLHGDDMASERVGAWFIEPVPEPKDVAISMLDIWNKRPEERTGLWCSNISWFTDEEAAEKLAYLREQGFEHIIVNDVVGVEETSLGPKLNDFGPAMIIPEKDLSWVFSEIESGHFVLGKVTMYRQPDYTGELWWV